MPLGSPVHDVLAGAVRGPAASGLLGYGALLVTVALGVAFPARGSRILRIGVPVLAAAFTVPLWWVITAVGVAPYTWPFVLVTWTVLALRSRQWRAGEARHDER